MEKIRLSERTTFGIGGEADAFFAPTEAEFAGVLARARTEYGNVLILGNGSKLLCADEGFRGAILSTARLNEIRFEGETVTAGAGVSLIRLAHLCEERGLSGLEWACGIPASVGGAVALNAGAFGGDIANVTERVACAGGPLDACECRFRYRGSRFADGDGVATRVTLRLAEGDRTRIRAETERCRAARRAAQPIGVRSAGSAFRRVGDVGAGYYIERAGCKGAIVGGARVSPVHANFIENTGGATCQDVLKLLCYIRDAVRQKFGVELIEDYVEVR